jgi:hypothetical protein
MDVVNAQPATYARAAGDDIVRRQRRHKRLFYGNPDLEAARAGP